MLTSATAKKPTGLSRPPCKCRERQLAPCGPGGYGLCKLSHHQALKDVAKGLVVTAMAPDGVIEGIESAGSDQVAAVQWHPENMWREHPEMRALFEQFIARVEKSVQK